MSPDSFNEEVIRLTIQSFYTQQQDPTLTTILAKLKENGYFLGSRFLSMEGFHIRKETINSTYMNKCNILKQEHTYLPTTGKLRNDNRTIIYTNKSWVNTHHCKERILGKS